MFAPKLNSLRRQVFQQVFETRSIADFEDLEDENDNAQPSLQMLDGSSLEELEDLEQQLDVYMAPRPNFQELEFNMDLDLGEVIANKRLVTTLLITTSPAAQHLTYHLHGLSDLLATLKSLLDRQPHLRSQCEVLVSAVDFEINRVYSSALDELDRRIHGQSAVSDIRVVVPVRRSMWPYVSPLAASVMILTAIIHAIMGVSCEYCNFILDSLRSLLLMVSGMQDNHSSNFIHQHLADIPTTLPTVLHQLDLAPVLDLYICCPKCSLLYPEKTTESSPEHCTAPFSNKACGERLGSLHHSGTSTWVKPTRRYSHMRFEHWLSELLLRPGIEDLLQSACPTPQEPMFDVWDAPYLCSFLGGNHPPFCDGPPDELRLVMLLYHDFFNPCTNKTAGKKRSVGCFFMICLNLPPDIRYDASNTYLASVVPGPSDATFETLNNFVRPIVDNMLEMYSPGIWIAKTHKYPQGRKVRAAVAIESLDTPAAHGMGGFGAHNHTCFCYLCTALRSSMDSSNLNQFQLRTITQHRSLVDLWVNASSKKAKAKLYKQHGVRHTDWLRLPWWNPFASMVVGPMHWTSNILDRHFRKNLDWSWDKNSGIPTVKTRAFVISEYEYDWGVAALMTLSEDDFEGLKLTAGILQYLCAERGIYAAGLASSRLVEDLNGWRRGEGILLDDGTINPDVFDEYSGLSASLARARYHVSKPSSVKVIQSYSSRPDLVSLCVTNGLPSVGTKETLVERLVTFYSTVRIPQMPGVGSKVDPRFSVLGKEILTEVKRDMSQTTIPSWLKQPPKAFATASHGKLQAEEYKSLILVSFVITLVRLWGMEPLGPLRDRLDSTLHLMLSVCILAFQSLLQSDITAFEHHYGEYIKRLTDLYPNIARTSVQHMGLHIPAFLRSLGPSTRFSESTCELFNEMLQGINTNFKFGDLELTLHREFVMASRLKALVEQGSFTERLGAFGATVKRFLEQHIPNHSYKSVWHTAHSSEPFHLTSDTIGALAGWASTTSSRPLSQSLFSCRKLQRGNVVYAPSTTSSGDSCIMFSTRLGQNIVGRIDFILQEPTNMIPSGAAPRIFLVVRPFRSLTIEDAFYDPYLNNPIIGQHGARIAQLYYDNVENQAQIIEPKDLISHVAVCTYNDPQQTIKKECIVVVSLDLKHKRYA